MGPKNNKEKEALRKDLFASAPKDLFDIEKEIAFLIEEQRFEKGLSPKEYGLEWDKIEGRATKRLRKIIHDKRVRIGKEKFRQVAIQTLVQKQNLPSFKAFREQVRARLSGEEDDQGGMRQRNSSSPSPTRQSTRSSPSADDSLASPNSRGRRRSSIVEDLRAELRELAVLWYESERANSGKVDWPKVYDKASSSLQALLTEKRSSTHFEQCPLELLVPVKDRRAFELLKSRLEQGMVSPKYVRTAGVTELSFLATATDHTTLHKRQRPVSGRLPSREPPPWRKLTIGSRVGIYWSDDKRYYKATVLDRYGGSSNMSVRYDDNVVEKLDMAKETIRVLEGKEAEKDDPSDYQGIESDVDSDDEGTQIEVLEVEKKGATEQEDAIDGTVDKRQTNRRAGEVATAKAASVWKSQRKDGSEEVKSKTVQLDTERDLLRLGKSKFAQETKSQRNKKDIVAPGKGKEPEKQEAATDVAVTSKAQNEDRRPRDDTQHSEDTASGLGERSTPALVVQNTEKAIGDPRPEESCTLRMEDESKSTVNGVASPKTEVVDVLDDSEEKKEAVSKDKSQADEGDKTLLVAEVLTAMGSLTKNGKEKKETLPSNQGNAPDIAKAKVPEAVRIPDGVANKEAPVPAKKRTRKRKSHEDQYLPPVLGELAALLARGTDENQRPDWKFIQRNASKSLKQYMNKKEGVSALVPSEIFDRFVHEVAEERNIWLVDELRRDPVTGEMPAPAPPPPPPPPVPQAAPQFHLGFPLAAMYANARAALANGHVAMHPVAAVAPPPVIQGEQFRKLNPVEDFDRTRKRRFGNFMNGARQDLMDYQKDEGALMESFFRGCR
eukprot:CAMPEP_0194048178 /NCGR_PEP_ID=MMETSP0009_2-20130614/26770_1 /TAXON_ID=210454 /ORGANISM="Grammatophora oceanica, Strain CCMP 410" /LENGTH=835 /DNA_ID=CAMNT_0038693993 /DNA_START=420 /DNA_END=2927 /DNA_ORIENTATION=-